MSAGDIEYMGDYKEFPTKESALDWLDNYLSLDERNNLIRALEQEPCEECVSREAVEDAIADMTVDGQRLGYMVAYEILSDLPLVKPQPKTGHWIGIDEEPHEDYECDNCGYVVSTYTANIEPHTEYKYCPNCGAKMQEVKE